MQVEALILTKTKSGTRSKVAAPLLDLFAGLNVLKMPGHAEPDACGLNSFHRLQINLFQ